MPLESLLWIDWVGLALAAYGLVAGAVRGLTQQFSRSAVWVLAALVGGLAQGATAWLATQFQDDAAAQLRWDAWFQLAVILAAVLALGALRRLLFGSSGAARSADPRGVSLSLPVDCSLDSLGSGSRLSNPAKSPSQPIHSIQSKYPVI